MVFTLQLGAGVIEMLRKSVVFVQDPHPLLSLTGCHLVLPRETEPVSHLLTMLSGLKEYYHSDITVISNGLIQVEVRCHRNWKDKSGFT